MKANNVEKTMYNYRNINKEGRRAECKELNNWVESSIS